jgi:hypothetical protein
VRKAALPLRQCSPLVGLKFGVAKLFDDDIANNYQFWGGVRVHF